MWCNVVLCYVMLCYVMLCVYIYIARYCSCCITAKKQHIVLQLPSGSAAYEGLMSPTGFLCSAGGHTRRGCLFKLMIIIHSHVGFHKWRYPNSWMVCTGTSYLSGWFRGTPIYGNPHMHPCFVVCWFWDRHWSPHIVRRFHGAWSPEPHDGWSPTSVWGWSINQTHDGQGNLKISYCLWSPLEDADNSRIVTISIRLFYCLFLQLLGG